MKCKTKTLCAHAIFTLSEFEVHTIHPYYLRMFSKYVQSYPVVKNRIIPPASLSTSNTAAVRNSMP